MLISTQVAIPVFSTSTYRSWPKNTTGGRANSVPLADALETSFKTDAHFSAYAAPAIGRRLSTEAPERLPEGVSMITFVADIDFGGAHKASGGADSAISIDEWWVAEQSKLAALVEKHPGAFIYRTRGGYRIVYLLSAPFVLHKKDDAVGWKLNYCAWISYLKRCFGIVADSACKDWTRLFRLPHATREKGGRPEMRQTIGDAVNIGMWVCEPSTADLVAAAKLAKSKEKRDDAKARVVRPVESCTDGRGVLFAAFQARGWMGQEIETGKWAVQCPFESDHTKGARFDTSTVLYAPGSDEKFGWLHCSHSHCQTKSIGDVLAVFSKEELEQANAMAGVKREETPKATADASDGIAPGQESVSRPEKWVLTPGFHVLELAEQGKEGVTEEVGADDFAAAALEAIPEGVLYRWDRVVGRLAGEPGQLRFVELTEHEMRTIVDGAARLTKWEVMKVDDEPTPVPRFVACSRDLGALVLAAAGTSRRVRELQMIVKHPVYQPQFILAKPGWNPESGTYYDESPGLKGVQPKRGVAGSVLRDLVIDFPFADASSRQNFYAAMLTLIVRPAVEACIPLFLVMAALERTGKGKLINSAIGNAILGRGVQVMQIGSSEEEREKRILALIVGGCTVIHFDNLPIGEFLDSAALASLATAFPTWSGRLLGVTRSPELPNRMIVFISGNNPKVTGEIAKRIVPIVLQPADDHPEDRTGFEHSDAEGYALLRRREVIEALLGLVEEWKAAGCPPPAAGRGMGGFERWTASVGGILMHAGCADWLGNFKEWVRGSDEVTADADTLIKAWATKHSFSPITATDVLALIRETGTFPYVTARKEQGQLVAVGKRVLPSLIKRPVAGWIVIKDGSGSSSKYRLSHAIPTVKAGDSGDSGDPNLRVTRAREDTRSSNTDTGRIEPPESHGSPAAGQGPTPETPENNGFTTTQPSRCYSCKGSRWWVSIHGVTECARCHPPAAPEMVAHWVEPKEGE